MPAPSSLIIDSPAKINLRLKVIKRLESGYHKIETIMQPIDLCDTVSLQWADGEAGEIGLECDNPQLPTGETNLAVRAAKAIFERFGEKAPGKLLIRLEKRIPVGAGLGGGSSNAAAVIKGLDKMLGLRMDENDMMVVGAEIGMDVPYFIACRPAKATGRGEWVRGIGPFPETHLVLLIPGFEVNTGWAYGMWKSSLTGEKNEAKLPAFFRGSESLLPWMENDLQEAVTARYPEIDRMVRALKETGAAVALMSGSGSAVYGLFREESLARSAAEILNGKANCRALVARGQGAK